MSGGLQNKSKGWLIQGDAQRMPFGSNSVDLVQAHHVAEHLPDPERFVEEMRRVLRPDELAFIASPPSSFGAKKVWRFLKLQQNLEHCSLFIRRRWIDIFQSYGFQLVDSLWNIALTDTPGSWQGQFLYRFGALGDLTWELLVAPLVRGSFIFKLKN
jgi:SAM-dependent methyltransferase